jgi:hypothetical protein
MAPETKQQNANGRARPQDKPRIRQHDWRLAALERMADQLQKQPEAHSLVLLVSRS